MPCIIGNQGGKTQKPRGVTDPQRPSENKDDFLARVRHAVFEDIGPEEFLDRLEDVIPDVRYRDTRRCAKEDRNGE